MHAPFLPAHEAQGLVAEGWHKWGRTRSSTAFQTTQFTLGSILAPIKRHTVLPASRGTIGPDRASQRGRASREASPRLCFRREIVTGYDFESKQLLSTIVAFGKANSSVPIRVPARRGGGSVESHGKGHKGAESKGEWASSTSFRCWMCKAIRPLPAPPST